MKEENEKAAGAKGPSAYLADDFQAVLRAAAEILMPGISMPAFDASAPPIRTVESMCRFRRTVLDLAYTKTETRPMMDDFLGGKALSVKDMKCGAVRDMFNALVGIKRASNNAANKGTGSIGENGQSPSTPSLSPT